MDREHFYSVMNGEGTLDYEIYLKTRELLSCQTEFHELCNADELQFQIVHQVEELWMKLVGYTLLDVDDCLQKEDTLRALTLFRRVHMAQRLLVQQLDLLETMSPKEYQEIRTRLGNGSGQESPGWRTLLKMPGHLWQTFQKQYLEKHGLTVEQIYRSEYRHGEAYVVAEAMAEFDELFQRFRFCHVQLVQRTIGLGAKSLKGRSVEILNEGLRVRFFPELWEIRDRMTDEWGGKYGVVRKPLGYH